MMNQKYPFQVWLTSICIAPILLFLFNAIISGGKAENGIFMLLVYFILYGIAFSLPSFFIYYFVFDAFFNMRLSDNMKKLLLSLIAIGMMWITFYCILGKEAFAMNDDFITSILGSYTGSIILSTFIFKLRKSGERG